MPGTSGNLLAPEDADGSRPSRIWDPTLKAYRAQRVPIALSKSSITNENEAGSAHTEQTRRSSTSSRTSAAPSLASSASAYSYSSAQSLPSLLVARPSSYSLSSKNPSRPRKAALLDHLPLEVYDCVLQQLRLFHEDPASQSCETCHLRDLCSLSLTSRAWDKAVRKRLYDCICILGHDSKEQKKKYKAKTGVRLKLLRRTLRDRSFLAQHVRELRVPWSQSRGDQPENDMINVIASIIMACPNFERLVGFNPVYGHEFDRLTHALSTRRRLRSHVWLIGENEAITLRSHKQLAPGLMDPCQKSTFLYYHEVWSSLETLFLHSTSEGVLEKDVFVKTFQSLPALKHLCISNFDVDDFDDYTLQHLPALHSLRLQDLEGITFWGLSEFSRTRNASSIRNLSLVNLDVMYISAISNLMLHCKDLKRFTLVQDTSPEIEEGEIVFQPIIASHTLKYIHWDILVPGSGNLNLAKSISANGFPHLSTIRAPSDHGGLLQALCKPVTKYTIPSANNRINLNGNSTKTSTSSLRAARQAAQHRIEEAWSTVKFRVVVEEEGTVNEIFDLGGFVGTVGSKITYNFDPDVPGSDNALVDFPDLLGEKGDGMGMEDNCNGSWKADRSGASKGWQHTERPRYRPVDLSTFF